MLVYKNLCPNCGGNISSTRLEKGFVCENCSKEILEGDFPWLNLENLDKLKIYKEIVLKTNEFKDFFNLKLGNEPWSLQTSWAKRLFLKESFSIIAPTGVGKTTWGIISSLFLQKEGKKTYFVLPTSLLVEHTKDRILFFDDNLKVLAYYSNLKNKEKQQVKEQIAKGDFDILLTTSLFLQKNFDLIKNNKFDFIFVDDVDSVLKSSKALDKILFLMGFDEKDLQLAYEKYKVKLALASGKKITSEQEEILNKPIKKPESVLVVSSATAKPRGVKPKILKELLGFEIGKVNSNLRNVKDLYLQTEDFDKFLLEKFKKLRNGILLFVAEDYGKDKVEELEKFFDKNGLKAVSYEKTNDEILEKFKNQEIQILIGLASWRNPLTRGLDMPLAAKYAFFYGVPKFIFAFNNSNPKLLLGIIFMLKNKLENQNLSDETKQRLQELVDFIPYLRKTYFKNEKTEEILQKIKEFCQISEVGQILKNAEDISFDGEKFILADVASYIQASGRVSRLYLNQLTLGLALTLIDNQKAFYDLRKKLKFSYDITLEEYDENKFYNIAREIEKQRQELKNKKNENGKIKILSSLMIVESPNKARTIANFFGNPGKRQIGQLTSYEISLPGKVLTITASVGHILDLSTKDGLWGVVFDAVEKYIPYYDSIKKCVYVFNKQEFVQITDEYEKCARIISDKLETIQALRKIAFETDEIYLATDPDIEGEKISFDLFNVLRVFNKDIKRSEYHEVTKKAILNAISNSRQIDKNLTNAQIARRIVDRWVGFALSEKLKKHFDNPNYSAGRVQTPVLGWIVEKTEKLKDKKQVIYFKIQDHILNFDLDNLGNLSKTGKIVLKVDLKSNQAKEKNPQPPFTTDELLKKANQKLRFSADMTMQLSQSLFEKGLITYHRTDSIHISNVGIQVAKDYFEDKKLTNIFTPRHWAEEGTHEAIRPTKPYDVDEILQQISLGLLPFLSKNELKLYDLIFRQFMASEAKSIKLEIGNFQLSANGLSFEIDLPYRILEKGFDIFFPIENLDLGKFLFENRKIEAEYEIRKIPKEIPFTQADLIQKMKETGLGRPSTYATIVSNLFRRGYVKQLPKTGWIIARRKGKQVYEFLHANYSDLISQEFTAYLESKLDEIEKGLDWKQVVNEIEQKLRGYDLI